MSKRKNREAEKKNQLKQALSRYKKLAKKGSQRQAEEFAARIISLGGKVPAWNNNSHHR